MKTLTLKLVVIGFFIILFFVDGFSQQEKLTISKSNDLNLTDYSYQAIDNNIFIKSYIPVLNDKITKINNQWTLNESFSDEFDSIFLDKSKWTTIFDDWNNNKIQCFAYNRNTDMNNHIFEPMDGCHVLSLTTKKEYYEGKYIEAYEDFKIMEDALPNLRPHYMTSAMINSINKVGPYGYYEIRCKIPSSRFIIADFWLWSADKKLNYYNEIDIFETENGKNWNATTHFRDNTNNFYHHSGCIIPLSGSYSDDFYTYGMKWEPQKITFYLNNQIVRTITEHIPTNPMRMYVNLGQEIIRSFYNPEDFPNKYSIDYIRSYSRSTPHMDFSINDKIDDVVTVYENSPIILNGNLPDCYNPNKDVNEIYYVSVRHCNASGVEDGIDYNSWVQSKGIENFDISQFCKNNGLNLSKGNYYRITLATSGPWTQKNKRIFIQPCTNFVDFSVNGEFRDNFTPIEINYDNGKPNIILDASKTISCQNAYFLSLQQCDQQGNGNSNELQFWLSSQDVANYSINKLDLRKFFKDKFNFDILYNSYYRIKVGTGGTWVSKVLIIHTNPCNCSTDFLINDQSRTNFTPIEIYNDDIKYGNHIYASIWPTTACEDAYYLSIQQCDQFGQGGTNTEYSKWVTKDYLSKFSILKDINSELTSPSLIDLRDYFPNRMLNGYYYRVKMGTGGTWTSKVIIIHLNGPLCLSNSHDASSYWIESVKIGNFTIVTGNDNKGYHDFSRAYQKKEDGTKGDPNGVLFAPQVTSGGSIAFVLTPGFLNSNVTVYWSIWVDLNEDNVFNSDERLFDFSSSIDILSSIVIPSNTKPGIKRMRIMMKYGSPITSPCQNGTAGGVEDYLLSVISEAGMIKSAKILDEKMDKNNIGIDENFVVFPNPITNIVNINLNVSNISDNVSINLFDLSGKEIKHLVNEATYSLGQNQIICDFESVPSGVYIIKASIGKSSFEKKIIKN